MEESGLGTRAWNSKGSVTSMDDFSLSWKRKRRVEGEGGRVEGRRDEEGREEGRREGGGRREKGREGGLLLAEMHKNLEQETKSLDSVARPRHERQEHLLSQRVVRNLG